MASAQVGRVPPSSAGRWLPEQGWLARWRRLASWGVTRQETARHIIPPTSLKLPFGSPVPSGRAAHTCPAC